jgi:hypothetical protein
LGAADGAFPALVARVLGAAGAFPALVVRVLGAAGAFPALVVRVLGEAFGGLLGVMVSFLRASVPYNRRTS